MRRGPAILLTVLTALFLARVAGQALAALAGVPWLPPMEAWHSGLLPYPLLVVTQVAILSAQVTVDWRMWRGGGWLATPRPRLGRGLRAVAWIYALAMLLRWLLTRTHAIPIAFHWVLAAYLLTLGCAVSAARTPRAADR
jgi:hypothetical protein